MIVAMIKKLIKKYKKCNQIQKNPHFIKMDRCGNSLGGRE